LETRGTTNRDWHCKLGNASPDRLLKAKTHILSSEGISSEGYHPFFDAARLHGKILSIGHNVARLRIRNTAIKNPGYQVTTTRETAVVLDLARKQDLTPS